MAPRILCIACGALAHELIALKNINGWDHLDFHCLPAHWHNRPEKITPGVAALIEAHSADYDRIVVAYGDCGTGGALDTLLARQGIERLPGPHCYSFFTGGETFDALQADEIGTFWLTDYLLDHFDRLILDELGLIRHPELRDSYFQHYTRMVWLAQQPSAEREAAAQAAAEALGLRLEVHPTGLDPMASALAGIRIVAA